jgi:hypothetical protein
MSQKKREEQRNKDDVTRMLEFLTDGMEKEPETEKDMIAQGFQAVLRTFIVILWAWSKAIRFMFKIIVRLIKMVFRKKKNKEETDNRTFSGMEQQFTQLQQGIQQPQQPQQPIPPAPAPPVQPAPQQSFQQQQQLQQPVQQEQPVIVQNPVHVIYEALKNITIKIEDIEKDIDNIYARLNRLDGVQPMPNKRIIFNK